MGAPPQNRLARPFRFSERQRHTKEKIGMFLVPDNKKPLSRIKDNGLFSHASTTLATLANSAAPL